MDENSLELVLADALLTISASQQAMNSFRRGAFLVKLKLILALIARVSFFAGSQTSHGSDL